MPWLKCPQCHALVAVLEGWNAQCEQCGYEPHARVGEGSVPPLLRAGLAAILITILIWISSWLTLLLAGAGTTQAYWLPLVPLIVAGVWILTGPEHQAYVVVLMTSLSLVLMLMFLWANAAWDAQAGDVGSSTGLTFALISNLVALASAILHIKSQRNPAAPPAPNKPSA
jgi:uncharacterized paraquat-inducible protein A